MEVEEFTIKKCRFLKKDGGNMETWYKFPSGRFMKCPGCKKVLEKEITTIFKHTGECTDLAELVQQREDYQRADKLLDEYTQEQEDKKIKGTDPLKCPICGQLFTKEEFLKRHKLNKHSAS